jgi:hypothetical protein
MAVSVARPLSVSVIRSALTIVRDESPNGHGLHRMGGDAGRAVINCSRDAEQNYPIVCTERGREFFHGLLRLSARGPSVAARAEPDNI